MNKRVVFIVGVVLFLFYAFVQFNFLAFYGNYGIPFGKYDVDVYMGDFDEDVLFADHVLLTAVPKALRGFIEPGMFFTIMVPVFACIILPLTVFFFSVYFSKSDTVGILSLVFFMFGTFSLEVYLISALWAQLAATVFALWFMVFFDRVMSINGRNIVLAILMGIAFWLAIFSHLASAGVILLFFVVRGLYSRGAKVSVLGAFLVGLFIVIVKTMLFSTMSGGYVYTIDVWYVVTMFAMPLFWCLVVGGILFSNDDNNFSLSLVLVVVALISPLFVLWRPLISVLPLVAYFAAKGAIWAYDYGNHIIWVLVKIIMYICVVISLFAFSFYSVQEFMGAMLWEMEAEPGIVEGLPRDMDSTWFKRVYFGLKTCDGGLDSFGEKLNETCR